MFREILLALIFSASCLTAADTKSAIQIDHAHRLVFDANSLVPREEEIQVKSTEQLPNKHIEVTFDIDLPHNSIVIDPRKSHNLHMGSDTRDKQNPKALLLFEDAGDSSENRSIELMEIAGIDDTKPLESLQNIYLVALAMKKDHNATAFLKAFFPSGVIHQSPNSTYDVWSRGYGMDLDGIGGPRFDALLNAYATNNGMEKMKSYLENLLATGVKVFLPEGGFPEIKADPELAAKITWEQ